MGHNNHKKDKNLPNIRFHAPSWLRKAVSIAPLCYLIIYMHFGSMDGGFCHILMTPFKEAFEKVSL